MKKMRVTQTPPGFAPEHIREQWVGVEIPLLDQETTDAMQGAPGWNDDRQRGGCIVSIDDAILALHSAQRIEAAKFWEDVRDMLGSHLRFGAEYCEEVTG